MNGKFFMWLHGSFVIAFIMVWIAAAVFGWLSSVVFVSHMSMVALVYAAAAAWQGARTEKKEDENASNEGNTA